MADYDCEWCQKEKICDLKYSQSDCAYEAALTGLKFKEQVDRMYFKLKESISLADEIIKEVENKDDSEDLESMMEEIKRLVWNVIMTNLGDCYDKQMIAKCKEIFKEELESFYAKE